MVITVRFDGKLVVLTVIYISIGIAALLLAFSGVSIWLPSNSSDMASWVQAFGSIAAIGGIWWQTNENFKKSSQDEKVNLYGCQLENMHGIELLLTRAEKYLVDVSNFFIQDKKFLEDSGEGKRRLLLLKQLEIFEGEFKRLACGNSGDTDTEHYMAQVSGDMGLLIVRVNNNFDYSEIYSSINSLVYKLILIKEGLKLKKEELKNILGYVDS